MAKNKYNSPQLEINKSKARIQKIECLICKEPFGNGVKMLDSHTIPRRNLKFLTENKNTATNSSLVLPGKVIEYFNNQIEYIVKRDFQEDFKMTKTEVGISDCYVFNLICSVCDNKEFESYENDNFVNSSLDIKTINALALKTYLYNFNQAREQQRWRTAECSNTASFANSYLSIQQEVSDANFQKILYYVMNIETIKKNIEDDVTSYFAVLDRTLDYRVPMAAHSSIPIFGSFKNKSFQINALGFIEEIIVIVLPDKDKSRMIVLSEKSNAKSSQWIKRFSNLEFKQQSRELLYILFQNANSPIVFSKSLINTLLTDDYIHLSMVGKLHRPDVDFSILKNLIPDFLDHEYSLKR